ncbi:chalcone isomerase family protein [Alphaproteobacteria bacterium]|nr:chalcone isomerase family protein [Alphaproteobacteria bacterium]
MMNFFRCLLFAVLLMPIISVTASANEADVKSPSIETLVPNVALVGEARFKVLFFKIYDAELFAPDGIYSPDKPYALRLTYLINAKEDRIVSQTVKEMKRQKAADTATIESWIPAMEKAFISMDKGSFADFIHTPDGRLTLLGNGEPVSVIDDPALSRAIMDIWLGPDIRDRDFQNALLGKTKK